MYKVLEDNQQHPVKHFDGRAMKGFPIKKMKWFNFT